MKRNIENLRGEIDGGLNGLSDQMVVDAVARRFSNNTDRIPVVAVPQEAGRWLTTNLY